MDGKCLNRLAEQIEWKRSKREAGSKEINCLLERRSCRNVVTELKKFMEEIKNKQQKNRAVLSVTLALLRRKLSDAEKIRKELAKNHLEPFLFGGLLCLMTGNLESGFCLHIEWSEKNFTNKYDFLRRFYGEFYYYDFIELFYAAKMIYNWSAEKFETLVWKDTSKLLLLNIYSHFMDVSVTQEFLMKLAEKGDDFQSVIALAMSVQKLERCLEDYEYQKDVERSSGSVTEEEAAEWERKKRQLEELANENLNEFKRIYDCASEERKVSFLIDFLLTHHSYPAIFAEWLIEWDDYLAEEFEKGDRIRSLRDLRMLFLPVKKAYPLERKHKCNKNKIYRSIEKRLIAFVSGSTGIYDWTSREENEFRQICGNLPAHYKNMLSRELIRVRDNLMVSELDRLVRYSIYLHDDRQKRIIDGMLAVIGVRE